jgi:transcriptional regulator with XRE-family HTH domain
VLDSGKKFRFSRETGIPNSTVSGWLNDKKLPDLDTLLLLVKRKNLSLDWLATGQGDMRRTGRFDSAQEAVWEWIRAELRAAEDLSDSEFDVIWNSLRSAGENGSGAKNLLSIALESVREAFRQMRLLHHLVQDIRRSSGRSRKEREQLADRIWALLAKN